MQAFGPYAGQEIIDFTELGNRTMFVISGKTGSGKTTIFDGISYAIYGKASGEDRSGPDLRSQFAKEDLLTEVSLEFSLRNKTYHIIRSPQQDKKKARGEGFTTISAKAELYTINENGEKQLLASNIRDVDEKIKEIMVIDSNQFRQILMIPQGEFRKLLTSESKEKEVILQRLFHTQIYKLIEEKLKDNAGELKRSFEKHADYRDQTIQQIYAFFTQDLKDCLASGSVNDQVILPLLKSEIDHMKNELGQLSDRLNERKEKRDSLQKEIYEAEAIMKQIRIKEELSHKKMELMNQKEKFDQIEKKIDLAHKSAMLAQQEEICHHLKREYDEANQELEKVKTNLSSLSVQLKEQEFMWETEKNNESERTSLAEEITRLKNLKEDIYSFSHVQSEVTNIHNQLNKRMTEKNKLEKLLKSIEETLVVRNEERQQIEGEKIVYLEDERKLERTKEDISKMDQYEQQMSHYNQAADLYVERKRFYENSVSRLADARALVLQLEEKWIHGQASLIAKKLQEGDACPVCGSLHHPNPANRAADTPDENDLKIAREQVVKLEQEKARAESAFFEVQTLLHSLQDKLETILNEIKRTQPEVTAESLPIIKAKLLRENDHLLQIQMIRAKRQESLPNCINEIDQLTHNRDQYGKQLQIEVEEMHQMSILYTEKNTNLTRMTEKIPSDLQSVEAYEFKLQSSTQQYENLLKRLETAQQKFIDTKGKFLAENAKYSTVEKQAERMKDQLATERNAFINRMHEQGFQTYTEYSESKKSDQEIQFLEKSLREFREEVRSVHDRYNELSQILINIEKPDIETLHSAFQENEEQLSLCQELYTDLYLKMNNNEGIEKKIIEINEQMKSLEDRYQVIGHLYEIAKGQNTYRITFERFVLAAFLDDILREANGRLRRMTSGRYELLRKTDRSKGNIQSGLELLVYDQYTGQERHVKTLSGGESFKAALALALGLADVVQHYAGGVSLETMFIDEGFGTLDPESLDQAIEALMDIQSSGRLVGIISHVPELKERIDARLEVISSQNGSQTEFQFMS